MPYTVIVHIAGEDAVVGEVAELPSPRDTAVLVTKVRRRDGKPVHYLMTGVDTVIWPMERVTFIEIVPPREARPTPQPRPAEAAQPEPSRLSDSPAAAGPESAEASPPAGGVLSRRRVESARPGSPDRPRQPSI